MNKRNPQSAREILNRWNPPQFNLRLSAVAITASLFLDALAILGAFLMWFLGLPVWLIVIYVLGVSLIGLYLLFAIKIAAQWEKAVVLRLGRYHGLSGPGLFWIIPIVDQVAEWIDHRVMVTPFSAEKTLTRDISPLHLLATRRKPPDAVPLLTSGTPPGRPTVP